MSDKTDKKKLSEEEAEQKLKDLLKEDIDKVSDKIKNRGKHSFIGDDPYDIKYTFEDGELAVAVTNSFNHETYTKVLGSLSLKKVPSQAMKEWMDVLAESSSTNTFSEVFSKSLEKGTWTQGIESEQGLIAPSRPNINKPSNAVISGDNAVNLAIEASDNGKLIQIPLIHSGFWVTIKPPSNTAIVTLFEQLESDKESIGRHSYGFVFSNSRGIYTKLMCELALSLVVATTKQLSEGESNSLTLSDIDMNDAPSLQAGILIALWFSGMPYKRPCVSDREEPCNYIHEGKLDISKLYWVNSDGLTDKQIAHMADRSRNSMTFSSIEAYKSDFIESQDKIRKISDSISMKLTSPSIADNVRATSRWMTSIAGILERAVALDASPQGKEDFKLKASQGTSTRQFSHYIKEIIIGDNIVKDPDTIDSIVSDVISASDELVSEFQKQVLDYIESSVVSMYAIPSFVCPVCNTGTTSNSDRMFGEEWLHPLDMSVLLSHGLSIIYLRID